MSQTVMIDQYKTKPTFTFFRLWPTHRLEHVQDLHGDTESFDHQGRTCDETAL